MPIVTIRSNNALLKSSNSSNLTVSIERITATSVKIMAGKGRGYDHIRQGKIIAFDEEPDMRNFTVWEVVAILQVIYRDQLLRDQQKWKLLRLKAELRSLRRRGARNALGEELSQGRSCARCKTQLGRIYNTGASCPRCRHRVCRQCREYRGSNGTDWLCLVCHKIAEIQTVSGEWMNEASGTKRLGRRKFLASPADILKRSIRRSWTINGPPASWCAVRGSPEFRAYQSLPRHQDYFELVGNRSDLVIPDQPLIGGRKKSEEIFISPDSTAVEEEEEEEEEEEGKKREQGGAGRRADLSLVDSRPASDCGEDVDVRKKEDNKPKENILKFLKNETRGPDKNEDTVLPTNQEPAHNSPRISQIKPPRIHAKINFAEVKQTPPKSNERKSNIPILRRSSKEFEDIRSPIESAKRSLIPQRYRGSTDDLRRSREDITTAHSHIPKLFSPRGSKDDRLKRQDSRDEIRFGPKLTISRKEERKDTREIVASSTPKSTASPSATTGKKEDEPIFPRAEIKSGIKIFKRETSAPVKDTVDFKDQQKSIGKSILSVGEENEKILDKLEPLQDEEVGSKFQCKQNPRDKKENGGKSSGPDCESPLVIAVQVDGGSAKEMVDRKRQNPDSRETAVESQKKFAGIEREEEKRGLGNEKENEKEKENEIENEKEGEDMENGDGGVENHNSDNPDEDLDPGRLNSTGSDANFTESAPPVGEKEVSDPGDINSPKKMQEDYQVVTRRKFSKDEFSNPDDTDEVPNRRSSSHLSPEASPLSTRSSRYSPRESESEPTPALPRKTGESSSASQRVRDAITRTRRESNSSTRYESSGSESIRLSGGVSETRRVRFGGGSGIEEVQRDSATSAGEDEPRNSSHNTGAPRDSRTTPGALQARAVRRRRQFDPQGSRRRGRSHARGCAEDFHHLQQVTGRGCSAGGGGHNSPPQGGSGVGGQQGQEQPIIDYRRLVFISSDSSSGREEDDADSSSGSSSLNGAPRSSITQGLEDCDWDYFESGGSGPPLAHLQVGLIGGSAITSNNLNSATTSTITEATPGHHPGISSLSSQDWSCCPGRGTSACQACGGARGANVFPVPVPIPVPVPYPVPVPASLWTSGLTNTSMINCTSAELGALQLSRAGGPSPLHPAAAQWFAWPPRFVHDVNGVRPSDHQSFIDAFRQARELSQIDLHASVVAAELSGGTSTVVADKTEGEIPKPESQVSETNAEVDVNVEVPVNIGEDQTATTEEEEDPEDEASSSSDCSDGEVNVEPLQTDSGTSNPKNSQRKTTAKMYRLSQGNSGSSSGRSSADSSDLEDSAAHHFSRVFVVNDDSSTSDNDPEDVEDLEDSDSNREVGITLRRVTALPEDGPVVLRHVRFLDEDRGSPEAKKGLERSGSPDNTEAKNSRKTIRLKYLRNFDPDANEIYLVDSKEDDAEHRIELKSVRSIDPDVVDEPRETTNPDKFSPEVETPAESPDPDSLMPETLTDSSSTIVPDSLEVNEAHLLERSPLKSSCQSDNDDDGVPTAGDICGYDTPETINRTDKPPGPLVTGEDKNHQQQQKQPVSLSSVNDDTATCFSEVLTPCSEMSLVTNVKKPGALDISQSLNLSGASEHSTTGSSETTTTAGSEVSSDELHEYEITGWSSSHDQEEEYGAEEDADEAATTFSAINDELIISRNLLASDKKLVVSESETSDAGLYSEYRDDNLPQNQDNFSELTSDGFSTDEGGSSRLDSGVATGVEDTNASGRTDDGSTASFETTPGGSIELVHPPGVGLLSAGDEKRCGYVISGDGNNRVESSTGKSTPIEEQEQYDDDAGEGKKRGGKNFGDHETSKTNENHTVNDLISIKIHEIFKSVESSRNDKDSRNFSFGDISSLEKNGYDEEESVIKINRSRKLASGEEEEEEEEEEVAAEEENGDIVGTCKGERSTESRQVKGGGIGQELERAGKTATAEVSSVERRPPVVKDGLYAAGVVPTASHRSITTNEKAIGSNPQNNFHGNRYKSLVMITQGAYQPVNVVTSDTTTLLQPDESPPPPRGLAGYYHLALETAAELPQRNGTSGPRRPLTVKRPTPQPRIVNVEPEVDSGLSVGSASESDDVQSVKSASKVAPVTVNPSLDQVLDQSVSGSGVVSCVSVEKSSANELPANRARSLEPASSSGVVVILEEGLADDDSWVEEVSHDEDEQGATTATEESSEDEANNLGDREEELRGYHRQAIDFTLHTIVEESCEESEAEPSSIAIGSPRKQRPPSASELEKYFFFGLGEGAGNIGGSREIDSLSETSSIYSEGLESLGQDEPGQNTEKNSPDYLSSSSRLEKYFLSDFLGFDRDRRDSDGSVGSDSEGRPSPEQRRKRLVRARGTGRSHSSSLDNLLALTQSSVNLSSQNSLQDLSLNPDSQETQSEGSSTETDGADDQMPAFGTDGQFDTVKRKKKKPRNLGTQSPRIPDDRNKTPEPAMIEADGDLLEAVNSEDDRAKTPQPDAAFLTSSQSADNNRVKQTLQASDSAHSAGRSKQQQSDSGRGNGGQGNEVNPARSKQHSRDSGFIGSCDDLLQHQRVSGSSDGQNSNGGPDLGKKDSHHERRSINDPKYKEGGTSSKVEQPVSQVTLAPPNASLSRKDSFNNWSSDEETNLMMSKMRQFFKTMVANSNNGQNSNNSSAASPAPSPRLPGTSPRSRIANQNRTKPPQLVYFENELTRLMKTVPGIRDEQVKEIVEYLSSEDTWSDSYDSSDYTSSDLEGAGGRRSALQEQISQSCQQIISKFDTTGTTESTLTGKEAIPSAQPAQPLNCRDTAFVYQKLVQSFTKMTGDGVSSDASSTPHSSPPLIAKVMHHIGSRLVALMHEVSEGGPAVQPSSWRRYPHHRTPSSASTTEDDDSTSDSANTPAQHQLPRSKSHDPLLLLNGHPTTGYQEGEEREASDNERFSWRGSFESALMPADSRTKLSLLACSGDVSASASALAMAAKRRSAGDLLFNPKSLSREQLDRVRSCGSIGGGSVSIEDKIWSNRRRSSVPDANTRGESGASAGDDDTEDELEYGGDSRATTLPRGLQSAATATNSLPRLPAVSPNSGPVTMHKAHSVHHFLQQHNNVKSARYRPPGFARNNLTSGAQGGPKRAVSAPGLQLPAGSNSVGKRETARSRRQAVSLTPDDGSSLLEACSTPIIGGVRGGSLSNDDEMDRSLHTSLLGNRASSSSLGARSDSMASVYSGAGEGRWCGSVAVRGEVEFALEYDQKQKTFEVRVTQCRDLAPVDIKRNRSDPYVKVYLLPDKSKGGKRKTKVKKHTLNPVFDETLKFHISLNGLETRTLWLTVWHSDMFGRNDFLGEVRMALENKIFDDLTPRWYPLQERSEPFDDPITCKGEVIVGLKFVPPDPTQQHERLNDRTGSSEKIGNKTRKSWSKGALHVLVKEARNLQTRAKHGGTCDPFCKSYLLPDKGRSGKQKTGVVRKCTGGSPVWGHTFVYKDVSLQELADRGLELTVWDHDRIASNEFLGGVRFNLGTGKHYGKAVEWMDATGRELSLWQSMLERPNFWVEGAVTLRPNLHNHPRNNTT